MTTKSRASVSVVIPCYNQAHFLADAIDSVSSQTCANHLDVDVIVVDDGSTDDTVHIASGLGARVIRQSNRGLSNARNAGLGAALSDLIVFLDADDALTPDALSTGASAFADRTDLACLLRYCLLIDSEGRPLATRPPEVMRSDIYAELLHRNVTWAPGAAMFRRADVVEAGGFPPGVSAASDYALYLRFARAGRLEYRHAPAAFYRQHRDNMSRNPLVMLRTTLDVLEAESRVLPAAYRAELVSGRREWCDFYGDQIVDEMRLEWREAGRLGELARRLRALVGNCPRVAMKHVARKLPRLLRGVPPAQLDPPGRIPASAVSGGARDAGR